MNEAERSPALGWRPLLALALPSAAFTILTNAYRVVDQYFVQHVSVAAQAAVGSSIFVIIFYFASFELIAAGAGPLVARATGAGDHEARRKILGQSIAAAMILTGLIMVVGSLTAGPVAALLGLSGEAARQAQRYLMTLSLTVGPLVLTPLMDQTFLAMGNARAPLLLHGLAVLLNIGLTALFVLVLDWGVVGAALASNGAQTVATIFGMRLLLQQVGLGWRHLRLGSDALRVLRIGAPMAASTAFYTLVYWGMLRTTISPLGPHVNAALGIGFSALEGFTWPLFHGLSLAVASLVGRYLGAGRLDLAERTIRLSIPFATILGLIAALAFWQGASLLTGFFTTDSVVHAAAIQYAMILAASQVFVAWESLSEGVLGGAGDTRSIFMFSAPINLLRIPLAWWLAFPLGWGAAGVWWAINVTTVLKAVLKGWAVWRGRWRTLTP